MSKITRFMYLGGLWIAKKSGMIVLIMGDYDTLNKQTSRESDFPHRPRLSLNND